VRFDDEALSVPLRAPDPVEAMTVMISRSGGVGAILGIPTSRHRGHDEPLEDRLIVASVAG